MRQCLIVVFIWFYPNYLCGQSELNRVLALAWDSAEVTVKKKYSIDLSRGGRDKDTVLVEYVELCHVSRDSLSFLVHRPTEFRMFDTTLHIITWDKHGNETLRLQIEKIHVRIPNLKRSNWRKLVWEEGWADAFYNIHGSRISRDSLGRITYYESIRGTTMYPMHEMTWSFLDTSESIYINPEFNYYYGPYGLDSTQMYSQSGWKLSSSYEYDDKGNLVRRVNFLLGKEDHVTTYKYDSQNRLTYRSDSLLIPIEEIYWEENGRAVELKYDGDLYFTVYSSFGLLAEQTCHWFSEDSVEIVIDVFSELWYDLSDTMDMRFVAFSNSQNQRQRLWFNYFGQTPGPLQDYVQRKSSKKAIYPGLIENVEYSKGDRCRFIWIYE